MFAAGHWGQALYEYMPDYNHWYTLGVLCELLLLPDNRVTVVSEVTDQYGTGREDGLHPSANNDRNNIALAERTVREILEAGGAQDVLAVDR